MLLGRYVLQATYRPQVLHSRHMAVKSHPDLYLLLLMMTTLNTTNGSTMQIIDILLFLCTTFTHEYCIK